MCTYLKNMVRFTHSQLKNKSFDEVQKAFDETIGWIYSFVSMDFEVVKGGKEKDEGTVTRVKESSFKRAGTELEQERIKKKKIDDDQEEWLTHDKTSQILEVFEASSSEVKSLYQETLKIRHDGNIKFRGGLLGIKRLYDDLGVNTAKLVMLGINVKMLVAYT
ncbi:hypothetical protein Tco_1062171 [Tanacetum coccineum]